MTLDLSSLLPCNFKGFFAAGVEHSRWFPEAPQSSPPESSTVNNGVSSPSLASSHALPQSARNTHQNFKNDSAFANITFDAPGESELISAVSSFEGETASISTPCSVSLQVFFRAAKEGMQVRQRERHSIQEPNNDVSLSPMFFSVLDLRDELSKVCFECTTDEWVAALDAMPEIETITCFTSASALHFMEIVKLALQYTCLRGNDQSRNPCGPAVHHVLGSGSALAQYVQSQQLVNQGTTSPLHGQPQDIIDVDSMCMEISELGCCWRSFLALASSLSAATCSKHGQNAVARVTTDITQICKNFIPLSAHQPDDLQLFTYAFTFLSQ
ncbi:hypothetical protein CYMTET_4069 [Cymbomonas tetramitiformis]|uniref:Uncharacterized protein n=1 Tax=Cymbomonas tetramitiformis TaxID=36881 RepID=A0AAE0LKS6_9CHLO|nr:hypothetical protein CYMTET_4069 [Cymbomonas tetramitiformis]